MIKIGDIVNFNDDPNPRPRAMRVVAFGPNGTINAGQVICSSILPDGTLSDMVHGRAIRNVTIVARKADMNALTPEQQEVLAEYSAAVIQENEAREARRQAAYACACLGLEAAKR